jgi:succinyl-CoA synthetase beta subunit
MKTIYKVLYPIGFEIHEVEDDFPTTLPFVEIKPLEGLKKDQSQFFNFTENKWEEAVTQDYSKKLELLENLSVGLQVDNKALKESNGALTTKTDSMAQLNAKLMLNDVAINKEIETIKTQIGGAE